MIWNLVLNTYHMKLCGEPWNMSRSGYINVLQILEVGLKLNSCVHIFM